MNIQYQEHSLDSVMRYFVSGFEPKPNEKITNWKAFVDTAQSKVVFKLFTERTAAAPSEHKEGE